MNIKNIFKQNKTLLPVIIFIAFAAIIVIYFINAGLKAPIDKNIYVGKWGGLLKTKINSYLLFADAEIDSVGNIDIKLSSPKQNKSLIPVEDLMIDNDAISFGILKFQAKYNGNYLPDSSKIVGNWIQEGRSYPLTFYRKNELGRVNRPQYPFRPFPYEVDSVIIYNRLDSIDIGGTFTYPKNKNKKYSTLLLLSGNGPQNRDEAMYGHSPFLLIADYLTREGYAVLRIDDRGVGQSTGNYYNSTTNDFAKDALAAIEYLKTRDEVDSSSIGILGYNEGGLIAGLTAANSKDVRFILALATPGLSGINILQQQTEIMQKKAEIPEIEIKRDIAINNKIFNILLSKKDTSRMRRNLKSAYKKFLNTLKDEDKFRKKYSSKVFRKKIDFMIKPWFRNYLSLDPANIFKTVSCPVLILYGAKDVQVIPEKNEKILVDALKSAGNTKVESQIIPGLNHMFQSSETGFPNEYGKITETFSPKALKIIKNWLNKIFINSK